MPQNSRETYPSPDHQLREIAAILARGVLRLRKNAILAGASEQKNSRSSGPDRLDVRPVSRLSVPRG